MAITASAALAAKQQATIWVADAGFGQAATAFTTTSAGPTARATSSGTMWVHVVCVLDSDGSVGLAAWEPTDASGQASFVMGPTPSWNGGSAHCSAEAGSLDAHGRYRAAATTQFAVSE